MGSAAAAAAFGTGLVLVMGFWCCPAQPPVKELLQGSGQAGL